MRGADAGLRGRASADGDVVAWARESANGALGEQFFCAICHTRLYSTSSGRPDLAILRAGTLDDSDALVPRVHIWTKRKQSWISFAEGDLVYPENAPDEQMTAMFAPSPGLNRR